MNEGQQLRSESPPAGERPRLGLRPIGRCAERVLLLCGYDILSPARTAAAAADFQARSAFAVTVVNMDARGGATPGTGLLQLFDAVVITADAAALQVAAAWRPVFAGPMLLLSDESGVATDGATFDATVASGDAAALDRAVADALAARGCRRTPELAAERQGLNVLLLAPHRPKLDPRLGWMADAAPAPLLMHRLGTHGATEGPPEGAVDPRGCLVRSVPTAMYAPGEAVGWGQWTRAHPGAQAAVERLLWMERALALPPVEYGRLLGAWMPDQRSTALREFFRYFLDVTATLVREATRLRNVDAIVATDLPTLPAGLLLGALFDVPVVFDAHEYWPEADLAAAGFEQQFWEDMERSLLPHTRLRATVSTGLAALMERQYGVPFLVLPNAEPRASLPARPPPAVETPPCVFLFQGGFARGRGIELLIEAWPQVRADAHLHLRGPLGPWRDRMVDLARSTGLLDRRIFFPAPVEEAEMVDAAARAHVGLVPYEPQGANHRHCCPNKLSQYMAAGLAVLANDTAFVREVVEGARAGLVVDFRNRAVLVAAVDRLVADPALRTACAQHARGQFAAHFHWEALAIAFYEELSRLVAGRPQAPLQLFGPASGLADNSGSPFGLYMRGMHEARLAERIRHRTPEWVRGLLRPGVRMVRSLLGRH